MTRWINSLLTLRRVLKGLLILAFVNALAVLLVGVDEPLIDMHSFRQTQTALSVFWLAREGHLLAYETPALGAPWSIPFEFPFFQDIVALVSRLGVPLDAAGRSVSFAFYLATLVPLRMLVRRLRLGGPVFLVTAILFLTCPLLLYWGRAFLMESCAAFFGLLWLALVVRYIDERRTVVAFAALATGCLAALIKSTTLPAFAFVGGVLVLARIVQAWRRREPRLAFTLLSAMFGLVPFAVGYVWVAFSDVVKKHNDIGRLLTSDALAGWNFGTMAQRFDKVLWIDTVWNRVLPDTLGVAFLLALMVLGASLTSRRHLAAAGLSLAAFTLPFVLFTNLHIIHNYYQSANAVFLVAAVGIAFARVCETAPRLVTLSVLTVVVAGQIAMFYQQFFPSMRLDGDNDRFYRLALIAKAKTEAGQSLIVFGDGWSSTIPYYSQRKSLVLPAWTPAAITEKLLSDPQSMLGGSPLGGVIYCPDQAASYEKEAQPIRDFAAHRTVLAEFGGCNLLGPEAEGQHGP